MLEVRIWPPVCDAMLRHYVKVRRECLTQTGKCANGRVVQIHVRLCGPRSLPSGVESVGSQPVNLDTDIVCQYQIEQSVSLSNPSGR